MAAPPAEAVELQKKFIEAQRLYMRVHSKRQVAKREKARAAITMKELENPPKTTYIAVGKMFMKSDIADIRKRLTETAEEMDEEEQKFAKQDQYLQSALTAMQSDLRQLAVHSK
eukprot:TRINITY_DN17660_c0_g1_i1.p3 TRINITY_DN17660_c0_g1~~TRINITY_DN17660_c0_g1_i1.p3  ORF type:complete len:121 (-),score=54.51 TRINITY_DN17660_c0_g1_i1:40-381(-)